MTLPNWITASQNSGDGTTILTITASTNSQLTARTAELLVSSATLTASTSISQLGRDAEYVNVVPNSLSFDHNGGTGIVRVESNGAWTASTNCSWITLNTSGSTGDGVIQVSASPNTSATEYTGTFKVRTVDDYRDVSVTKAGYTWVSADTGYSLTFETGRDNLIQNASVRFRSNGTFTLADFPEWLYLPEQSEKGTQYTPGQYGSTLLTFSVSGKNQSFIDKTGDIVLTTPNMELRLPTTWNRSMRTLSVTPSATTNFEYSGETKVFTVESGDYWSITEKPSWLTISPMNGGSGITLVSATSAPNNTSANKYGDLVFANADATVTVPVVSRFYAAITVNYYIESGGTNVRIVNEYQDFESITVDGGTPEAITSCYRNISTGNHTIVFRLTGDTVSGGAWIYEYDYPSTTVILDMKSNLVQDVFISKNVRSISGGFAGQMSLSSVTFEQGSRLEEIGFCAFERCYNLRSIDIPSSVNTISYAAFRFSGLDSVSLPDSVLYTEESVFYGCPNLQTAYVPTNVGYVKNWFAQCSALTGVSYTGLGSNTDSMFNGCTALTTVYMPNAQHIGEQAFYNCGAVTSWTLSNEIYDVGYEAFSNCTGLTSFSSSKLQRISNYAFYGCYNLTTLDLYDHAKGLTYIGNFAFNGCAGITTLDLLLSKITVVGNYAFAGCSSLQSIKFPATFTSAGTLSFASCTSLNEMTFLTQYAPGVVNVSGDESFRNVPSGGTMYVPSDYMSNYTDSRLNQQLQWNIQPYIPTDFLVIEDEVSYLYCETGVTKTIQVYSPDSNYTVSVDSADFSVSGTPAAGYTVFGVSSNVINTGSTDITATVTFTRNNVEYPVTLRVLTSDDYDLSVDYVLPAAGAQTINKTGTSSQGRMIIDDTLMPISTTYTFGSTGNHNVKYIFNNKAVPDYFLENSYHTGYTATAVSVTFGDKVEGINWYAFHDCTELTGTVSTPESLTRIDINAFTNTGIQDVYMYADTLTCGAYCFSYCTSLQGVHYKEGAVEGGFGETVFWGSPNVHFYYIE